MTIAEYLYRMKAHALQRVDVEYDLHLSAWLHIQAQVTEQKGKKTVPKFKTFKEFFDYEERVKMIEGDKQRSRLTDKQRDLAQLASKLNS